MDNGESQIAPRLEVGGKRDFQQVRHGVSCAMGHLEGGPSVAASCAGENQALILSLLSSEPREPSGKREYVRGVAFCSGDRPRPGFLV